MSYNGYANYETWNVSLWLNNDEGNYNAVRELARYRTGEPYALAADLREYVESLPEATAVFETASFVSDLLGAALSEVDWHEIAENVLSEIGDES